MTSHDVVDRVRRILKEKRVGHTGTLDPLATGLLVMCVGTATRIARFLEAGDKEYAATMRLGVVTDTLDAEGRVLETRTYVPPERDRILDVLLTFSGEIMQRPPVFSAVKVGGVSSYKLARKGMPVELKPRPVTIHSIGLETYEDPLLSFTVHCSKGTYIRTLCADVGDALGTGGHLTSLVRTRSGRFKLDNALTLEELSSLVEQGRVLDALISIDRAIEEFPAITLSESEARKAVHGNAVASREARGAGAPFVRLYGPEGQLIGIARPDGDLVKPEIVFSRG
jgi:tRNA pseudouridine55 synthase